MNNATLQPVKSVFRRSLIEQLERRKLLAGVPYGSFPFVITDGAQLEAEHFDIGGEGVAYHDLSSSNLGGDLRPDESVDLETTSDVGGGYNVGWTQDGEWLEYIVDVDAGTYDIQARVASNLNEAGSLRLSIGSGSSFTTLGTLDVSSTGGWQDWQTLTLNGVELDGGAQVLRAEVIGGSFNLNWIGFDTTSTAGTTRSIGSGFWQDSSIWSDGVPTDQVRAIVSQNTAVLLDGDAEAHQLVVHGVLSVVEAPGVEQTLTTDWIHVNSGGIFQIGSESNRYDQGDFTLTLTGTNPDADYTIETATGTMQITDNDGFLMPAMGGRLQFFGEEKLSFTKLSQTANAGTNSIIVENVIERNFDGTTSAASDGSLNWEVGDQIVIASSTRDYDDQDVRTITAITPLSGDRTRLTLNANLSHRHYGEIETYDNGTRSIDLRAEVAL
ncbi:MAG: carbohydrate-binding protein, partial [Planctomycetota bacterium]